MLSAPGEQTRLAPLGHPLPPSPTHPWRGRQRRRQPAGNIRSLLPRTPPQSRTNCPFWSNPRKYTPDTCHSLSCTTTSAYRPNTRHPFDSSGPVQGHRTSSSGSGRPVSPAPYRERDSGARYPSDLPRWMSCRPSRPRGAPRH